MRGIGRGSGKREQGGMAGGEKTKLEERSRRVEQEGVVEMMEMWAPEPP